METMVSDAEVRELVAAAKEAARLGGAELMRALSRERVIVHKGEIDLVTRGPEALYVVRITPGGQ